MRAKIAGPSSSKAQSSRQSRLLLPAGQSNGYQVQDPANYDAAIEAVGAEADVPAAMGVITFCMFGAQLVFPLLSGWLGLLIGPGAVFLLLAGLVLAALGLSLGLGSGTDAKNLIREYGCR